MHPILERRGVLGRTCELAPLGGPARRGLGRPGRSAVGVGGGLGRCRSRALRLRLPRRVVSVSRDAARMCGVPVVGSRPSARRSLASGMWVAVGSAGVPLARCRVRGAPSSSARERPSLRGGRAALPPRRRALLPADRGRAARASPSAQGARARGDGARGRAARPCAAQVNPHFLFNSLNSIGLARRLRPAAARACACCWRVSCAGACGWGEAERIRCRGAGARRLLPGDRAGPLRDAPPGRGGVDEARRLRGTAPAPATGGRECRAPRDRARWSMAGRCASRRRQRRRRSARGGEPLRSRSVAGRPRRGRRARERARRLAAAYGAQATPPRAVRTALRGRIVAARGRRRRGAAPARPRVCGPDRRRRGAGPRACCAEYLADARGSGVVAECANGFEAVRRRPQLAPDLVLLDVQMPKLDGFEVLELLRRATSGGGLRHRLRRVRGARLRGGGGGLPAQTGFAA